MKGIDDNQSVTMDSAMGSGLASTIQAVNLFMLNLFNDLPSDQGQSEGCANPQISVSKTVLDLTATKARSKAVIKWLNAVASDPTEFGRMQNNPQSP